jgi:hypothetical protein
MNAHYLPDNIGGWRDQFLIRSRPTAPAAESVLEPGMARQRSNAVAVA